MKITITGDKEIRLSLYRAAEFIDNGFWDEVRNDYFKNIQENVRDHIDSGVMSRNIFANKIENGVEGGVYDNGMMVSWRGKRINYAAFLEYGTRAHDIEPSKKKALRFISGGAFVFSKKVRHPGTPAVKFMQKAAQKTFDNLDNIFNKKDFK